MADIPLDSPILRYHFTPLLLADPFVVESQ